MIKWMGEKWTHKGRLGIDFDVQSMRITTRIPTVSARLAQMVTVGDRAEISPPQADTLNYLDTKNQDDFPAFVTDV